MGRIGEDMVTDLMPGRHYLDRVAVRMGVISHAAVTGPVVFAHLGHDLVRREPDQRRATGGEQRPIHKIAPGNIMIHSQRGIMRLLLILIAHIRWLNSSSPHLLCRVCQKPGCGPAQNKTSHSICPMREVNADVTTAGGPRMHLNASVSITQGAPGLDRETWDDFRTASEISRYKFRLDERIGGSAVSDTLRSWPAFGWCRARL